MAQAGIQTTDFTKWLTTLLTEAFGVSDSPDVYFQDSGTSGLLGTINQLSAETASRTRSPEHVPIASHCGHVLFLLQIYNAFERGERPEIDWESSWKIRDVDDKAWATLRSDLQREYDTMIQGIEANDQWPEQRLAASIMLLTHCAYHLGEIKQLLGWVSANDA